MKFAVRFYRDGKWWMAEVPRFDAVTQGLSREEIAMMVVDLVIIHLADVFAAGNDVRSDAVLPEGCEWVEIPAGAVMAARVRGQRESASLTVRDAAQRIGVSAGTYQRWENPRSCNASVATLARIAKAYGKELAIAFV